MNEEHYRIPEKDKKQIVDLLSLFMSEMNQWELAGYKKIMSSDIKPEDILSSEEKFATELENIYKKYCSPKKRKNGRAGSYGILPAYDPAIEKIIKIDVVTRNKVEVFSERSFVIIHRYKYVIIRKKDQWLIDNRQRLDENGLWKRAIL